MNVVKNSLTTLLLAGAVLAAVGGIAKAEDQGDPVKVIKTPLTRAGGDCSNLPDNQKGAARSKGLCDPNAPKTNGYNPIPAIGDCGVDETFVRPSASQPGVVITKTVTLSTPGAGITGAAYGVQATRPTEDGQGTVDLGTRFGNFEGRVPPSSVGNGPPIDIETGPGQVKAETIDEIVDTLEPDGTLGLCFGFGSSDETIVPGPIGAHH